MNKNGDYNAAHFYIDGAFFSLPTYAKIWAGYFQVDISPSLEEAQNSCLGGYGLPFSRCAITEVNDSIYVRTLGLSDRDTLLFFSVIDTVGVGDSVIDEIKNKVFRYSFGAIPKNAIYITATHTHSGPDLQGLWGGISADYRSRIIRATTRSILQSYATRQRARIYSANTTANIENRRGWDTVDNAVNIIDVRSRRFGHRIATLVNMSAHPTIIDEFENVYSSDYVGFLRDKIEKNANSNVIFINGIVGDAQASTNGERGILVAKQFGEDVADQVVASLTDAERVYGSLRIDNLDLSHPLENPLLQSAVEAGLLDLEINDNTINTRLGIFSIGSKLSGILFPGEALTRLGLPRKQSLPSRYKLFFGLTGDSYGYFIPSDEFLAIPGRDTEEVASISPAIGDVAGDVLDDLIRFYCK